MKHVNFPKRTAGGKNTYQSCVQEMQTHKTKRNEFIPVHKQVGFIPEKQA